MPVSLLKYHIIISHRKKIGLALRRHMEESPKNDPIQLAANPRVFLVTEWDMPLAALLNHLRDSWVQNLNIQKWSFTKSCI
jgi:hypothetical protein